MYTRRRRMLLLLALASTAAAVTAGASIAAGTSGERASSLPKVIKIGVILPLTGGQATSGQDEKRGFDLAVQEINKTGFGPNKTRFQIIYEDNQGDPNAAVQAAQRLVTQEKVAAILGESSSGTTAVTAGVCSQTNMLCILTGGSNIALQQQYGGQPWYWHMYPYGPTLAHTARVFFESQVKPRPKTMAIIYENSAFGTSFTEAFKQEFANSSIRIVDTESFTSGAADFSSVIAKIRQANADIVFFNSFPQDTILLWSQFRQANYAPPIMASASGASFPEFVSSLKSSANYATGIEVWVPTVTTKLGRAFVIAFSKMFKRLPTHWAAMTYTSLKLYEAALLKANSTDLAPVAKALKSVKMDSPMGVITFDKYHQALRTAVVFQIQHGSKIVLWPKALAQKGKKFVYPAPGWSKR